LVQCPTCGTEVPTPARSWPVSFKKLNEEDGKPQLCVGIFECPECKSKFRARVEPVPEPKGATNVAGLVEKINSIREGLTQTLNSLRVKIKTLETERSHLLAEVKELKQAAELRASALEAEITQLREEIKSMREVLGSGVPETV
jgi:DNA repair exonuclease SbcCD ATPase subunit